MSRPLRSFRLAGPAASQALGERLLLDQGFRFAPLPFLESARLLLDGPLPLGSSLAARFGCIYIQDASSMLPALVLDRLLRERKAPGRPPRILDMCASPGGKSSLAASLSGEKAFVLCNEPGQKRLATLRRNLETLNHLNCSTSAHAGEALPLPPAGNGFAGWDCILLDPPCSAWGTAAKNPEVLELWQGEKLKPLIALQRLLLAEAARLLKPGGCLVYSTCTVNTQENEEQIAWALSGLRRHPDPAGAAPLRLIPLEPFPGFSFSTPELAGTLRVSLDSELGQGFYLAALQKSPEAGPPEAEGGRGAGRSLERAAREAVQLAPADLDAPLVDSALLPPGSLLLQGENLYFYPALGLELLPDSFNWRGFPLGKSAGAGSRPRLNPRLRALMPGCREAALRGADLLNVEEPETVRGLLSGQSLKFASSAPEVGLYYKDMPLCRLKARGGRVFI